MKRLRFFIAATWAVAFAFHAFGLESYTVKNGLAYDSDTGKLLDGTYKSYYDSGKLSDVIVFKEGYRTGVREQYWANGNISTRSYKKKNRSVEISSYYAPEGQLLQQVVYDRPDHIGAIYMFDGDQKFSVLGNPTEVLELDDHERLCYKSDGKLFSGVLKMAQEGDAYDNDAYGIYTYIGGLKDGPAQTYRWGELRELNVWSAGTLRTQRLYDDSGNGFLEQENRFDAEGNGSFVSYYTPGERVNGKGFFKNYKVDGEVIYYYENGAKFGRSSFKEGNKDGLSETYYPEGELKSQTIYKDNLKDEIAQTFYLDGKVKTESTYRSGKELSYVLYNQQGTVLFAPDNRELYSPNVLNPHANLYNCDTREWIKTGTYNVLVVSDDTYAIATFVDGKRTGELKGYSLADGHLVFVEHYIGGKKSGAQTYYDAQGEISKTETF